MNDTKTIYLSYEELLETAKNRLVEAGLSKSHAQLAAEAICTASLRGTDSHGIRLLPHYVEVIKAGRIDSNAEFQFEQTAPSVGILDANHGMAHAAVATAMDHAVDLAKEAGMGLVSVKNSNHCGAMAYYGLRAANQDMIGLAFTNATAKVKVFNARKPFFGINPVCFTAPMATEEPFCYDSAPTVMSNNKIKILKEQGEELPEEVAADSEGQMTVDPALAKMLLPLGGILAGYKGHGMSMVVDILCSLLSGMPSGRDVSVMYPADGGNMGDKRHLGQMVGAIRIDSFTDPAVFKQRLQETADQVRRLDPETDSAVMIPGDPEKQTQKTNAMNGIPISKKLWERLLVSS